MSERRRWLRVFADLLTKGKPSSHCQVAVADHQVECAVLDISCGGMRLHVLSQDLPFGHLVEGQRVDLLSFAEERLDFLAGRGAHLAWIKPEQRQFGVAFAEILRAGRLEELNCP
jgi:hypothetical protein